MKFFVVAALAATVAAMPGGGYPAHGAGGAPAPGPAPVPQPTNNPLPGGIPIQQVHNVCKGGNIKCCNKVVKKHDITDNSFLSALNGLLGDAGLFSQCSKLDVSAREYLCG